MKKKVVLELPSWKENFFLSQIGVSEALKIGQFWL
jgi:hypothetical protein